MGALAIGFSAFAGVASAATHTIQTFAGSPVDPLGDGGPATAASLDGPSGLAVAPDDSVLIADVGHRRVRRVSPPGTITTVAGTGVAGFSGDGGPANAAQLGGASDVAIAPDGSIMIADTFNHRVRRVSPAGIITTFAGGGSPGVSGDGGPAGSARMSYPGGVAVAPDGSVLISSNTDSRVRRVSPAGIITTFAGTGTVVPGLGDGGPATAAELDDPRGMAVAPDGSVLIAEGSGNRVRRVSPAGTITTIVGTGTAGFSGDGGPASAAQLHFPTGLAVAPDGSILIADADNARVRRVSPTGVITTLAGTGAQGTAGDGGPATEAQLTEPVGVAATRDGKVLIADDAQGRVRIVDAGLTTPTTMPTGPAAPGAGKPGGSASGPGQSAGAPKPAAVATAAVCGGRRATIVGTAGNDELRGTSQDDVIVGLGGSDVLRGFGGADRLCGGAGADRLFGGAGADRLSGGAGSDLLRGGIGADRLFGGLGADRLYGEVGNDVLFGQAGADLLRGGLGRDVVAGGPGRDNQRQ